jgi:polysaccharide deacetylase 2 family uncharacterized protein YibQ
VRRGRKKKSRLPFLALLACAGIGVYLYRQEADRPVSRTAEPTRTPPAAEKPTPAPRRTAAPKRRAARAADFEPEGRESAPALALVLDDVGFDAKALERLGSFEGPLALAVIPTAPLARQAAALAVRKKWDLLVHLPMEPEAGNAEASSVGPKDDDATIAARVARAIEEVPGATGLNNHQGSRATADARVVRAVLQVVGERDLFFLDSRTTAASVAEAEARKLGIRTVARDVFLDDAATEASSPGGTSAALEKAWESARAVAAKKGACVLIAHPHKETLDFLSARLASAAGLRRVRVSQLAD